MRLTRFAIALLLAGCGKSGPGPSEDCPLDSGPELEIGVGSDSWTSIEDAGGEATLVHGAQGGYHLELGLRATGLDSSDLASAVLTGSVGGQELALSNTWVQFRCNSATGTSDAWNVRVIYDADPQELDGQQTEVEATVTDTAGTKFSATATLLIVDPLLR